ncbi:hypothetical protein FBQ95_17050 [Chloroflexi bacterium CFX3]|nr:hypothetical protein [Chloroflexi bacterium CFX3]
MLFQVGDAVYWVAAYTESGVAKTGLTDVTCTVWQVTASANTVIANAQPAVEVGGGLYKFVLPAAANTEQATLIARFSTADSTVDAKEIYGSAVAGYWAQLVDAAISTRLAAGATVSVTQPVAADGSLILYIDDNAPALGTEIQLNLTDTPADYSDAIAVLKIGSSLSTIGVVTGNSSNITAVFTITSEQKAALGVGQHPYQMHITKTGLNTVTVDGQASIKKTL